MFLIMWHHQLENVRVLKKISLNYTALHYSSKYLFQSQYSINMKETNCEKYISYSLPLFDM